MAEDGMLFLMGDAVGKDFLSLQIEDGSILLKACEIIVTISLQATGIKLFKLLKLQRGTTERPTPLATMIPGG